MDGYKTEIMTISGPLIEELIKQLAKDTYIISRMINQQPWYYHNLREEPSINGVIWTPYIQWAHTFNNEKDVEEFKSQFISPRKVEILRIRQEMRR